MPAAVGQHRRVPAQAPGPSHQRLTEHPALVDENQPGAAAREFPIFDTFASFQRGMLQELFTPDRLARLANSEFRAASPQDTLTMATLFRSVGDRVWSELRDGREISELRRSLQVDHLNLLIDVAMNRDPKLEQVILQKIRDAMFL